MTDSEPEEDSSEFDDLDRPDPGDYGYEWDTGHTPCGDDDN